MNELVNKAKECFGQLLQNAATGDLNLALQAFREVQPFVKRSNIEAILYKCATSGSVCEVDGIFFLCKESNPDFDFYATKVQSALGSLTEHFQLSAPVILVELADAGINQAHSIGAVPGIGYMHLDIDQLASGAGYSGYSKEGTIAHEVTHCIFYSGSRVLDEGIATYGEYIAQGLPTGLLHKEFDLDQCTPNYQDLLSSDFSNTHMFSDLYPDNPRQIYVKSALLIKHIVDNYGMAKMKTIFNNPLIGNFRLTTLIIEDELGLSLSEIEKGIFPASNEVFARDLPFTEDDNLILLDVNHWYNRQELEQCEKVLPRLSNLLQSDPNSLGILEAFIKAKGTYLIQGISTNRFSQDEAAELSREIQAKIIQYIKKNNGTPVAALFGILYEAVELVLAGFRGDKLRSNMAFTNCKKNIEKSRKKFPNDISILLAEAAFVREAPETYGGGKYSSAKLLESHPVSSADPHYSDYLFITNKFCLVGDSEIS